MEKQEVIELIITLIIIRRNEMKKLNLKLVGKDGNAFALMGYFKQEARKKGWTNEEMKKVTDDCMSGDYDHLLQTLMSV